MKLTGTIACVVFAVGCGGGGSKKPAKPSPDPLPKSDEAAAPAPTPTPMEPMKPAAQKSLYDRLGGMPAIQAVVGEFVARVAADPRINQRFFNTDIENLKKLLADFVCGATGGPCKYTGRSMGEAHGGMEVVDEEFGALVEDLSGALDKFNVPAKEKGELLGALGPLKPQIVISPDKLKPIDQPKLDAATKVASGIKDKTAQDLLNMAVTAGKRGQRNYAEQLFTRAEMITGQKPLATIAGTFRNGAPPRIQTALKTMPKDSAPQPATVGNSDQDNPDKKPAGGSLHGTLRLDGKPLNGLGVIQLWPEKGGAKRVAKTRVIEQRNKVFAPHVMAVPVGSTVSFPNFDPIFHNVFSLSKVKAFDLGMYKNGETREIKVDKPGIIRLGCNLHATMSAYVVVVDAPHYAVVEQDGSFKFASLKPGKYKVQGWSEQSGEPLSTTIEIKAGDNETNLDLKAGTGPGISPDKFGTSRQ